MPSNLTISLGQSTDKGIKAENEDSLGAIIPDDEQLEHKGIAIAIADGMSGCDAGKEASEMSVRMFLDDYYSTADSWTVKKAVVKVMTAMNQWLYSQGQRNYDSGKGMVTTFSACVLKSQTMHLFHVGDSRIYRLRDNDFVQLTQDHRIQVSKNTEYLSRALGIDINLNIDYRTTPMEVGDIYFLSTDGVHDFLNDARLRALIQSNKTDFQKASEEIVGAAKEKGSDDNLSCQVFSIVALPEADKDEFYEKITRLPFPPELKEDCILDGYKIIRELNATSRSQVYLAQDTLADDFQKVVIKTPSVNYEDDPGYIDLFLQEEWVGKRLNSPHLIKTLGENRKKTLLYTVVEYIQGQTLKQWMVDNPQASIIQVRATLDQIARGLRCMHRMEMIHQDLKPDNVLIDKNNTVKIIDFGSTKIAGLAEVTSVIERQNIVGTASYSAPEYFQGHPGTRRSDIFSLGVIAYEMFTGKLPYGEISSEKAAKKKFKYISARTHNPTVPEWIDSALKKATSPDPEKRYSLLSEFVADLAKPNNSLLNKPKQPLMERNPSIFWQAIALIELVVIGFLVFLD